MFPAEELSEGLPQLDTRQALIVLDLQNDFIPPKSRLPVNAPADYLKNIRELVQAFRKQGDIIWIRTEFETERPISQDGESDSVITNHQLSRRAQGQSQASSRASVSPRARHTKISGGALDHAKDRARKAVPGSAAKSKTNRHDTPSPDREVENEAFLTKSSSGKRPTLCLPSTDGAAFADSFAPLIDEQNDSVFVKSHYSAFRATDLLPHLRGQLVTSLFVCGVISNVSVLATTLDAARHAYSITLVEDCLGYRDQARHREALRQMTEYAGAEITSSAELLEEMRVLEQQQQRGQSSLVDDPDRKAAIDRIMAGIEKEHVVSTSERGDPASGSSSTGQRPKTPSDGGKGGDLIPPEEKIAPDGRIDSRHAQMVGSIEAGDGSGSDEEERGNEARDMRYYLQMARQSPSSRRNGPKAETDGLGPTQAKKVHSEDDGNARHPKLSGAMETGNDSLSESEQAEERDMQYFLGLARRGAPPTRADVEARVEHKNATPKMGAIPSKRTNRDSPDAPAGSDRQGDVAAVSTNLKETDSVPVPRSSQPPNSETLQSPPLLETATKRVVRPVRHARVQRTHVQGPSVATLGPGESIGEGDSRLVPDLLPSPLKDDIFDRVKDEVQWKTMHHRGGEVPRLVAVQGTIDDDGSFPVYRHPADESPPLSSFSPAVLDIKEAAERILDHPLNHALIQYYRDGHDYISEHSDKTLDIVHGSNIVNVSLGAQRTMTLRTKRSGKASPDLPQDNNAPKSAPEPGASDKVQDDAQNATDQSSAERITQKIPMPHNSTFVLGQNSNMRWLHGIRQDKRPEGGKGQEELAFKGERISLTFRHIGTFLDKPQKRIWGQGARSKTRETAGTVINGGTEEGEQMIKAFGAENQRSEFDREATYGRGFNALHIAARPSPKLFTCGDPLADIRVKLYLAESGVDWEPGQIDVSGQVGNIQPYRLIRFIDGDADRTEIGGVLPILMYLEFYHQNGGDLNKARTRPEVGEMFTRMGQSNDLLNAWRALAPILTRGPPTPTTSATPATNGAADAAAANIEVQRQKLEADRLLGSELELWDTIAARSAFIGGRVYSMADAAVWPVLREIVLLSPMTLTHQRFPTLMAYYRRVEALESSRRVLSPPAQAS